MQQNCRNVCMRSVFKPDLKLKENKSVFFIFTRAFSELWNTPGEKREERGELLRRRGTSGWRGPAASWPGAAPSWKAGSGGLAAEMRSAWVGSVPARRPCGHGSGGRCGPDSSLHPPGSWGAKRKWSGEAELNCFKGGKNKKSGEVICFVFLYQVIFLL